MKNCLVILLLLALSSSDATRRKRADDVSYDALVTLVQQQGSVIEDLQARLGASDAKVNGLTSEMNRVKSQMEAINQTGMDLSTELIDRSASANRKSAASTADAGLGGI